MKHLLIIGARGFGREVYCHALQSVGYGTKFDIVGFLDDKSTALDGYEGYPPIIDSVEHYEPRPDDVFICALGDVGYKKLYAEKIQAKGGQFINIIHQTASISKNVKMGTGCIIAPYVSLSCDVTICNFITFQRFAAIGHDAHIGDYCHLNTYSFMGGFSQLGTRVTLWTSAAVLPHMVVEDQCVVGASAVVIKRVKAGTTVYGNPAKVLKY